MSLIHSGKKQVLSYYLYSQESHDSVRRSAEKPGEKKEMNDQRKRGEISSQGDETNGALQDERDRDDSNFDPTNSHLRHHHNIATSSINPSAILSGSMLLRQQQLMAAADPNMYLASLANTSSSEDLRTRTSAAALLVQQQQQRQAASILYAHQPTTYYDGNPYGASTSASLLPTAASSLLSYGHAPLSPSSRSTLPLREQHNDQHCSSLYGARSYIPSISSLPSPQNYGLDPPRLTLDAERRILRTATSAFSAPTTSLHHSNAGAIFPPATSSASSLARMTSSISHRGGLAVSPNPSRPYNCISHSRATPAAALPGVVDHQKQQGDRSLGEETDLQQTPPQDTLVTRKRMRKEGSQANRSEVGPVKKRRAKIDVRGASNSCSRRLDKPRATRLEEEAEKYYSVPRVQTVKDQHKIFPETVEQKCPPSTRFAASAIKSKNSSSNRCYSPQQEDGEEYVSSADVNSSTFQGGAKSLHNLKGNHHVRGDFDPIPPTTTEEDSSGSNSKNKKKKKSFPRPVNNDQWNIMYERLLEYKAVHGDCLVPQRHLDDPKLGKWVCYQRKRKDNLEKERRRKLEEIGFVFLVRKLESWDEMFDQLVEYKAEHGDCLVPQSYKDNPKLGKWVAIQRIYKDSLTPDRKKRMEDIGFVWSVNEALWDKMFEALIMYKQENGHCRVPWNYSESPQLANWVQRQKKNRKRLPEDRVERLQSIGFEL